jgi:hypothetical protein
MISRPVFPRAETDDMEMPTHTASWFFENAPDVFGIVSPEGGFMFGNPAWEAVTGWPLAELLGQPLLRFLHAESHEAVVENGRTLAKGGAVFGLLLCEISRQGDEGLAARLRASNQRHAFQGRWRGKHNAGGPERLPQPQADPSAAVGRGGDVDGDTQNIRTIGTIEGPKTEPSLNFDPVLSERGLPAGVLAEHAQLAPDLAGDPLDQRWRRRLARLQGAAGARHASRMAVQDNAIE